MQCIKPVLLIFLVAVLASCTEDDNWKMAAEIEESILMTTFPADTVFITDFGAVADDASFLNTGAIAAAILKCHSEGGGVVFVPEGRWTTGPITLMSNVNLHIAKNATLAFSTDYELYLPPVLTRWAGMDCYNIHPLIYARDASNLNYS